MNRLFLCCFRSCLKGDNDKEYYTTLEIEDPYSASTEQIKRQYKKLSLSFHPDKLAQKGIEVTAEHRQHFIKLKEAYDVLSDPKRRRLYDEYGLTGLKLMENPTELDHSQLLKNFQKNRGDRTTLGLVIASFFAILLLLPILFSLKCDGTLNHSAKWVAIWTPMWIVDILLLISAGMILSDKGSNKSNNRDTDQDVGNEDERASDKIPLHEKILNVFSTICFILIQIFILIRLDGYTDWSWFIVFIPWFVYEVISIVAALPMAFFTTITPPNHENIVISLEEGEEVFMQKMQAETEYFEKLLEQDRDKRYILINVLRIWLAIFLALQVDGIVNWNWGLVLLPIWIYLFIHYIYAFIYRAWAQKKLEGLDVSSIETGLVTDPLEIVKVQQSQILSSNSFFLCFGQAAPLFMAIMLVCRLQVSSYSTFLIILPVFLIIGCCCCLVFCGLIGLSVVDTQSLEEEIAHQQQAQGADNQGAEKESTTIYHPPPSNDPEYGTFHANQGAQSPLQEADLKVEIMSGDHAEREKLVTETNIDPDID